MSVQSRLPKAGPAPAAAHFGSVPQSQLQPGCDPRLPGQQGGDRCPRGTLPRQILTGAGPQRIPPQVQVVSARARSDSNITLREEEATLWAEQTVVALILGCPLLRRCLPEENSPQCGKWRCLKRIVEWSFSPTASIPERFQVCCLVKETGLFPLR